MRIAVIGAGGMGLVFARQFKDAGFDMVLSSRTREKLLRAASSLGVAAAGSNVDVVKDADVVVVSVPIEEMIAVLEQIRPHVKKDAVVVELASVKKFLLPALKKFKCDAISLHPMFGPQVKSFEGQVFIVCPVRGEKWLPWLRDFLEKRQGRVVMSTSDEHDRIMAVVQCLTHFSYIAVASSIRKCGVDVKQTRRFSSPVYELMLDMIARIVGQDPHMYASIQMYNPYAKKALRIFLEESRALKRSVDAKDEKKFVDMMAASAKGLGDMESALYKSNKVLSSLREELRQLMGLVGGRVALRHEQSGEVHFGLLDSVTGDSTILVEDGKSIVLKISNVRLLTGPEAKAARRQRYGVTRRDFSCLFSRGFSADTLPAIVGFFLEDVAEAKVVDIYESPEFCGKKSITLRTDILNDSNVKEAEEKVAKLLMDLGGEKR